MTMERKHLSWTLAEDGGVDRNTDSGQQGPAEVFFEDGRDAHTMREDEWKRLPTGGVMGAQSFRGRD